MGVRGRLELLDRSVLVKTNPLDQGDWSYRPFLGTIMRWRCHGVRRALARRTRPTRRLLEVGYGSGFFLPELARWCTESYGADVHDAAAGVRAALADAGVRTHLTRASVTALPYAADSFDAIVILSALEFVEDLDAAAGELARVLVPGGTLVVVTPGQSPVLDLGLRLLTGERGEDTFEGRRTAVVPALSGALSLTADTRLPRGLGRVLPFYRVLELSPRGPA